MPESSDGVELKVAPVKASGEARVDGLHQEERERWREEDKVSGVEERQRIFLEVKDKPE